MARITQRGSGASVLGNLQKLPGHGSRKTCSRSPCLSRGLDQMSSRGTFQLQQVSKSAIAKPLQQKLNATFLQISPPYTLILTLPPHHLAYQALNNLLQDIAWSRLHFNYSYFLCSVSSNYYLTELNRSQILYLTEHWDFKNVLLQIFRLDKWRWGKKNKVTT